MLELGVHGMDDQLRLHQQDTGSADVQIALLTERISRITGHLKGHGKDLSSRRGLLRLVANRRRLLTYLENISPERYRNVGRKLQLRGQQHR